MPSAIVQINISLTSAPIPITLQEKGAIVSMGGTQLANGKSALLTQAGDLTALLDASLALTSATWSGGTVVATAPVALQGVQIGDVFTTNIAGFTPAGYNGLVRATVTGANTFSYPLSVNPGAQSVAGTFSGPDQAELVSRVNSFFAQGSGQAVAVLELGPADGQTGPPLLQTWLANNPGVFYSFLVPRSWDAQASFQTLIALYQNLSSMVYFWATTTTGTYGFYTALMKNVFAMVESPSAPLSEFSCAAAFQHSLSYNPDASNRSTPFAFSFLFGVTPYPTVGNNALLVALKAVDIAYVGTGAEGGITNTILFWGKMCDGNDFSYWFSVDWIQLHTQQAIANAVINGSNDKLNPLYYNQQGINRLQDVAFQTVQSAITFGLANGTAARSKLDGPDFAQALDDEEFIDQDVVNAIPFIDYVQENPSAYKAEYYGGLSLVYIPQRGFTQIIFNINVTDFLVQ